MDKKVKQSSIEDILFHLFWRHFFYISESTCKEIYKYLKSKSIILRKNESHTKKDTYHKGKHPM